MQHIYKYMMSGSKAPDFDTYGLFRATHSHVSAPLRSVLNMCHWHIAPYQIFAYRGIIIPLLCSYWGGSQGLSPTYERAHVSSDLLTLVSYNKTHNLLFTYYPVIITPCYIIVTITNTIGKYH